MDIPLTPLRQRREAMRLTLRDVERITDGKISNSYLSQLENGKIKEPSAHVAQILAATYSVPIEDMLRWLTRAEPPPPPPVCESCGRPFFSEASR